VMRRIVIKGTGGRALAGRAATVLSFHLETASQGGFCHVA
jgi:hypothetical protein